ncbi:MAG: hypothetical protein QXU40_04410 [Candidatus Pacearchaeota archaeon]
MKEAGPKREIIDKPKREIITYLIILSAYPILLINTIGIEEFFDILRLLLDKP